MASMRVLGVLMGMLFLLAQPGLADVKSEWNWRTTVSSEGGFSVLMPGTPTVTVASDHTVVGEIREYTYDVTCPEGTFQVEYQDLPGLAMLFVGRGGIIKRAKQEFLKHFNAIELSDVEFAVGERKGRRVGVEGPQKVQAQVVFLMKGNRLFVVVAAGLKNAADYDRFLTSFQLLPTASAQPARDPSVSSAP